MIALPPTPKQTWACTEIEPQTPCSPCSAGLLPPETLLRTEAWETEQERPPCPKVPARLLFSNSGAPRQGLSRHPLSCSLGGCQSIWLWPFDCSDCVSGDEAVAEPREAPIILRRVRRAQSRASGGGACLPRFPESRGWGRSQVDSHLPLVHLSVWHPHLVLESRREPKNRSQRGNQSPFLKIPRKHVLDKYMTSVINSRVPFRIRSNRLVLLGTADTSKQKALYSATWSPACGYLFPFFLFSFLVFKHEALKKEKGGGEGRERELSSPYRLKTARIWPPLRRSPVQKEPIWAASDSLPWFLVQLKFIK